MNELVILLPFLYLIIIISIYLFLKTDKRIFLIVCNSFLIISCIVLIVFLSARSLSIDFFNITNMFEVVIAMFIIISVTMLASCRYLKQMPFFFIILSVILFIISVFIVFPVISKSVSYPKPALRSPIISFHVSLAVAGETFLLMLFFLQAGSHKLFAAKNKTAKKMRFILSTLGYFFFTLGALVIGPVWAKLSWGKYWSWDSKEISSLIVWIFFTIFIFIKGEDTRSEKARAVLIYITFFVSVFTFMGIPLLTSSLHSH